MRHAPALIVGGGPAGAAAAITLARAQTPHLLVERTRETADALCGGFLSWRTIATLSRLGVEAEALNPARITMVRVFVGGRRAEVPLPYPALAVSRRRLDEVMLARARTEGAAIERGVAIRSIDGETLDADGSGITCDALFLASGKHDIRGLARPAPARNADPAIGLRVRLPASAALDRMVGDAIELHLFDGGYAGVVRQEDGSVNLCLAARRSRLRTAGEPRHFLRLLGDAAPALGERLGWMAGEPIDAVANVPYGWRARPGSAGLFRLGDQAGVIPSLAGEGIGIAVASGLSAALAYRRVGAGAGAAWQAGFRRALFRPIRVAGAIRHVAERPVPAGPLVRLIAHQPVLLDLIARATRVPAPRD